VETGEQRRQLTFGRLCFGEPVLYLVFFQLDIQRPAGNVDDIAVFNAAFGMAGIGDTSDDFRIPNLTPRRHFGHAVAACGRAVFDQVFQPLS
jgi:hypothetical protein